MGQSCSCPSIAVVGAGAAGTLTVVQLLRQAQHRAGRVHVLLFDPRPSTGRGVAYSTADPQHRLNVSAGRISALPDDPDHFLRWLQRTSEEPVDAATFAPRQAYGRYLEELLAGQVGATGPVTVERIHQPVTGAVRLGRRWRLGLGSGQTRYVDSVVLALGSGPADDRWAPPELLSSPAYVPDPWADGALARVPDDGDVLLVGTGLTMVDVALSLHRPGRSIQAVSRHGLLPRAHHADLVTPAAPPEGIGTPAGLPALRAAIRAHVTRTVGERGDWRPAIDGLRPLTQRLWQGLDAADRAEFLRTDAREWEVHRHRMAAPVARAIAAARTAGSLRIRAGEIAGVRPEGDRLVVELADGTGLQVAAVVNCTGPLDDVRRRDSSLLLDLLTADRLGSGPLGLGLDTDEAGRVRTGSGQRQDGLWAIGSLRRGQLWESTAIPEIRAQAREIADAILDELPDARRPHRPRDRYGLALSASAEAAYAYGTALEAVLRVQSGAEISLRHAATVDPGFALAHAGLALLGHEWGAAVDVDESLTAAVAAVRERGDERERSFVAAVEARIRRPGPAAAATLLAHTQRYAEDALALSIAVPTIAFGGATEVPAEAWALVEGLAPAYGSDWWYAGMLAFVRQEQERWDEAAALSERALAEVPSSGHAVHARAHVYYETGDHDRGLGFLDTWIDSSGRAASHRAHFSWHAALHELAMGDDTAVRRRYDAQLAPPAVSGMRALVDSASLLWRAQIQGAWDTEGSADHVLAACDERLLAAPPTSFAALHVAVAFAAAGDGGRLGGLAAFARASADPVMREAVAPVAVALAALVAGHAGAAADGLSAVLPVLWRVGGSAAQREVVEDSLLYALIEAGRCEAARELLSRRLDRRPSPRERSRLSGLERVAG